MQVNRDLLQALDVKVSPEIQQIPKQEREKLKSLHSQFASLTDKLRVERRFWCSRLDISSSPLQFMSLEVVLVCVTLVP